MAKEYSELKEGNPMFNSILITMDTEAWLVNPKAVKTDPNYEPIKMSEHEDSYKMYTDQKVVKVGPNVTEVKVGDWVEIAPENFKAMYVISLDGKDYGIISIRSVFWNYGPNYKARHFTKDWKPTVKPEVTP